MVYRNGNLNEFRYQDCSFYVLDGDLKFERNKIAYELGDIQENTIDGWNIEY